MSEKVCVVVGVGPGMGLALARRFGKEGYWVGLIGRRATALEDYILTLNGIEAMGVAADAGDAESLQQAFRQLEQELGHPDVLIYNAAAIAKDKPSELEVESLVANFRVNVGGALVATQQVLPHMRAKKRGTILFTGGGLGLNPSPHFTSLAVGKAALRNLTYSLASEVEKDGIHVATVTIAGFVKAGTFFAPDLIAEKFWALHMQPQGAWDKEIIYKPGDA